jgi:hypothetical protein
MPKGEQAVEACKISHLQLIQGTKVLEPSVGGLESVTVW